MCWEKFFYSRLSLKIEEFWSKAALPDRSGSLHRILLEHSEVHRSWLVAYFGSNAESVRSGLQSMAQRWLPGRKKATLVKNVKPNDNRKLMNSGNDVIANEWNFFLCLRRPTINNGTARFVEVKKTRWEFSSRIFLVFKSGALYLQICGTISVGRVGSSIESVIQCGALQATSCRCVWVNDADASKKKSKNRVELCVRIEYTIESLEGQLRHSWKSRAGARLGCVWCHDCRLQMENFHDKLFWLWTERLTKASEEEKEIGCRWGEWFGW